MTTQLRFIVASLALGLTAVAHAQSAAARMQARTPSPIVGALDTNHDGMLSAAEIAAAPATLTALDVNEDGMIATDELLATNAEGRPVRAARSASAFNLVLALDANHDGDIQPLEIANAVSSLKRLDLNRDGELAASELRPAPLMVARAR